MKKLICLLFCCLLFLPATAQWKWHNPMEAGFPVIQNQGFTKEIGNSYTRLPERAKGMVSEPLWNLSRHSAGLAIHFYSDAPQIKVRYAVTGSLNMPHMPSTGVSGVDLYSINSDGEWHFCFGNYSFKDTITYTYNNIGKDRYHKQGFEYRLYLPLYNGVKWLEIGIPEDAKLEFIPVSPEKPIVLYGTSIAQGACASRPAMAWGTILQRSLDYPLINLGFSGNGKLAKEVLQFINETDARLYILDCMPNLSNQKEEEVTALAIAAVKQLRGKHSAPILLIEHGGYSNMYTDSTQYKAVVRVNRASRKAYELIQSEGIKDVYYLSREELNIPADGWVDYVHPSDLGMQQQAAAVERKVREILHIPSGNLTTTIPVTQRREPHMYEWHARHRAFLEQVRNHPPKAVILGNSITHYWGGEPEHRNKNGRETWEKVMRPAGFQPDTHKRAPVLHAKHPVRKPGRPCVRAGGVRDEGLLFRCVAREKIGQNALRRVRDPLQYGEIVLFKCMRLHLPGQDAVSHARPRVDHHAAHGPVEPVHDAHAAGFVLSQRPAQQLRHAARLVSGQNARRLETDDDSIVGV